MTVFDARQVFELKASRNKVRLLATFISHLSPVEGNEREQFLRVKDTKQALVDAIALNELVGLSSDPNLPKNITGDATVRPKDYYRFAFTEVSQGIFNRKTHQKLAAIWLETYCQEGGEDFEAVANSLLSSAATVPADNPAEVLKSRYKNKEIKKDARKKKGQAPQISADELVKVVLTAIDIYVEEGSHGSADTLWKISANGLSEWYIPRDPFRDIFAQHKPEDWPKSGALPSN